MPDLETQLRRYGELVDARYPDVPFEEIIAAFDGNVARASMPPAAPPLRPRRGLGVAVAAALIVFVLVGGTALLVRLSGRETPPVVTTPQPVEASEWPLGLVLADGRSVWLIPFEAPEQPIQLLHDRGFVGVDWALPDQQGGLIFQAHLPPERFSEFGITREQWFPTEDPIVVAEAEYFPEHWSPARRRGTNLPIDWLPGAVLWLRAGASTPELLIPPTRPSEGYGWPWVEVVPVGVTTSPDQHTQFVYAYAFGWGDLSDPDGYVARLMAADLDDDGAIREIAGIQATHQVLHTGVATAGGVVAVFDLGGEDDLATVWELCVTVSVLRVDDGSPLPAYAGCLPFLHPATGMTTGMTLSPDRRAFGVIQGLEDWTEQPLPVQVIDLATGSVLEEGSVNVQGLVDFQLVASPGGWLTYTETDSGFSLTHLNGDERLRIDKASIPAEFPWPVGLDSRSLYHHPLRLAPDSPQAYPFLWTAAFAAAAALSLVTLRRRRARSSPAPQGGS